GASVKIVDTWEAPPPETACEVHGRSLAWKQKSDASAPTVFAIEHTIVLEAEHTIQAVGCEPFTQHAESPGEIRRGSSDQSGSVQPRTKIAVELVGEIGQFGIREACGEVVDTVYLCEQLRFVFCGEEEQLGILRGGGQSLEASIDRCTLSGAAVGLA